MIINWPGMKRVKSEVSRLKKEHKTHGAKTGKLRLVVLETGTWFMALGSEWEALPSFQHPAYEGVRYYAALEDVDLTKPSNSEQEAKSLLASVKEEYVLSHATLDDGEEEMEEERLLRTGGNPSLDDVQDVTGEDSDEGDLPDEPTAKLAPEYVQGFNDGAQAMTQADKKALRSLAKTPSFTDTTIYGEEHAAEKGKLEEDNQQEHQGVEGLRTPPEASGGDSAGLGSEDREDEEKAEVTQSGSFG